MSVYKESVGVTSTEVQTATAPESRCSPLELRPPHRRIEASRLMLIGSNDASHRAQLRQSFPRKIPGTSQLGLYRS